MKKLSGLWKRALY